MAKTAERKRRELLWTAALELMGRDAVRIKLTQMLPDRSATFKLPNQPGCKRGFAEDWLGRMEAEDKARDDRMETVETKRFQYIFRITVATVAVGIVAAVAAWPVIRDWIK